MMKQEFENLAKMEINQEDYEMIELVYTFHPSISETSGKKQIVSIYHIGGMRIIKDMYPTAFEAYNIDTEIQKHKQEIRRLEEQLLELSK